MKVAVVVVVVMMAVACQANDDKSIACKVKGAICSLEEFCPEEDRMKGDLCNKSQVCCKSLPTNIKNCERRGGLCRLKKDCKIPKIKLGECLEEEVCCPLV